MSVIIFVIDYINAPFMLYLIFIPNAILTYTLVKPGKPILGMNEPFDVCVETMS